MTSAWRRRGALASLLALLMVASQARGATDTSSQSPEAYESINTDHGESPDDDVPCQNALLQPQMKDKRLQLTPRQIQKDKVLQLLVKLRAELEAPRSCNVSSINIITACTERPTKKKDPNGSTDMAEYGELISIRRGGVFIEYLLYADIRRENWLLILRMVTNSNFCGWLDLLFSY